MSTSNIKRGAFIVIEGLDRSGKSTQSSAILNRLQAHDIPAKLIKFPDRTTPIGKMIDGYLKSQSELDDRAIHLLFSANRWELATWIRETLFTPSFSSSSSSSSSTPHNHNQDQDQDHHPTLLLADRYAFSGTAFSTAKGLPYTWCRAPDIALPAPDLTLFLDISPEHARTRGGYGEERYEREDMQRAVREVFGRMAAEMVEDSKKEEGSRRWMTIDASRSVEQVTNEIWDAITPLMYGTTQPLGRLWTDGAGDS